jgi:hypothetical protein
MFFPAIAIGLLFGIFGIFCGPEVDFFGLFYWSIFSGIVSGGTFHFVWSMSGDFDFGDLIPLAFINLIIGAVVCFLVNGGWTLYLSSFSEVSKNFWFLKIPGL